MATPSAKRKGPQRRTSDLGAPSQRNHVDQGRRRTFGTSPAKTPSKHQVNLGSDAAAAYYFGDTPHSTAKKKHNTPLMIRNHGTPAAASRATPLERLDETADFADMDMSLFSTGTSSTEESDLMNKSVLSDTTELSASTFVLQASSKQRLEEFTRTGNTPFAARNKQGKGVDTVQTSAKPKASTPLGDASNRMSIDGSVSGTSTNATNTGTSADAASNNSVQASASRSIQNPSPSMRSRLSTSPNSLKKLVSSLKKEKRQVEMQRHAARRSSIGGMSLPKPVLAAVSVVNAAPAIQNERTATIATNVPLEDLLKDLNQKSEGRTDGSRTSVDARVSTTSPSSSIATRSSRSQRSVQSVLSPPPPPTRANDGRTFHLTPGSRKKLTPTKLSPKPRRLPNPESLDSPARNTRSAKKGSSPFKSSSSERLSNPEPLESPVRSTRSAKKGRSPSRTSSSPKAASVDSPAKNTRSAKKKKGASPSKPSSNKKPNDHAGEKRTWDVEDDDVIDTVIFSQEDTGRVSEISMASALIPRRKRRKSSAVFVPAGSRVDEKSTFSGSTANFSGLNDLLGSTSTEANKEMSLSARDVQPSPATHASAPKSILTSEKKRGMPGSHSRNRVGFRSPQAASYHIESPSKSLTPMPAKTAKAMFGQPTRSQSQSFFSSSSEETVESRMDEGDDTISIGAGILNTHLEKPSPDKDDDESTVTEEEDATVEVETDLQALLSNTFDSQNGETSMLLSTSKPKAKEASTNNDEKATAESAGLDSHEHEEDDVTVEMEGNVQDLLSNTFGSPISDSSMLQSTEKPKAKSTLVADQAEDESVSSDGKENEDTTVEVESNMQDLLTTFGSENNEQSMLDSTEKPIAYAASVNQAEDEAASPDGQENEDTTVEVESNMQDLLATTLGSENSESSMLDSTEKSEACEAPTDKGQENEDDVTVEVEANMQGLLSNTFGSPTSESSMLLSTEKSNVSASSTNKTADDDKSPNIEASAQENQPPSLERKEQCIQSFQDQEEEDNTIEVEADLASLLANTDGMAMSREAPRPVTLSHKFSTLEGDRVSRTNRVPLGELTSTPASQGSLESILDTSVVMESIAEDESSEESGDQDAVQGLNGDKQTLLHSSSVSEEHPVGLHPNRSNYADDKEPSQESEAQTNEWNSFGTQEDMTEDTRMSEVLTQESLNDRNSFGTQEETTEDNGMLEVLTQESANDTQAQSQRNSKHQFSTMEVESRVEHTTESQVSATQETDSDMQSLLRAVEGPSMDTPPAHRSVAARSEPDTPSESRRRSSHRFSLTRESRRLSLSAEGGVLLDSASENGMNIEQPELKEAEENFSADTAQDDDVLELEHKDIIAAAALPQNAVILASTSDIVGSANTASMNFRNPSVADTMNQFVSNVCTEIEQKAAFTSDGESCFAAVADEKRVQLLELQKAIRSHGDTEEGAMTLENLKTLAQHAQLLVNHEWNCWESQVIEALAGTVASLLDDCQEGDEQLDDATTRAGHAFDALSVMEGKAVQKARRRSMHRRQTASKSLEAEIQELELQVDKERASLTAIQDEQLTITSIKTKSVEHQSLAKELDGLTNSAETSLKHFKMIKGMQSWCPLVVESSKVVVAFIGACPKTCVKVSFLVSEEGAVSCKAELDTSLFQQRSIKKLKVSKAASTFVETNMRVLIDELNSLKLKSGGDIGATLQRFEQAHGRLEMTTSELLVLEKRYKTMMELDPVGKQSDFLLSVDFESRSDRSMLRGTFELSTSYPFAPLNISLDDRDCSINANMLKRQLTKNAKPGFGYLLRTCDTISAFLR